MRDMEGQKNSCLFNSPLCSEVPASLPKSLSFHFSDQHPLMGDICFPTMCSDQMWSGPCAGWVT